MGLLAVAYNPEKAQILPMARTNPITFLQQVRTEVSKVIWPTRNETLISTVMVLLLVILTAIFFLVVDQVIQLGVHAVLSLR